jgi:hypothetical protein
MESELALRDSLSPPALRPFSMSRGNSRWRACSLNRSGREVDRKCFTCALSAENFLVSHRLSYIRREFSSMSASLLQAQLLEKIQGSKNLYIIFECQLSSWVSSSVVDSCFFATDPDPRIRITDLRIRIRLLLFSSMADNMPTKISFFQIFFAYYFSKVHLHQSSKIKVKKAKNGRKYKSRFFFIFLLVDPDP